MTRRASAHHVVAAAGVTDLTTAGVNLFKNLCWYLGTMGPQELLWPTVNYIEPDFSSEEVHIGGARNEFVVKAKQGRITVAVECSQKVMLLGISPEREFWGREDGKSIQVCFDVSQAQESAVSP